MKTNPDGYHTWTDAEVERFLDRHAPATKPRLVLLSALNTGKSRQDLCRAGWQHVSQKNGTARIAYKRAKTSVAADLPILPELAEELATVPKGPDAVHHPGRAPHWLQGRVAGQLVPGPLR